MSNTVQEKVKVSELSKFGFKFGNEYVNYSKKLTEDDKTRVVPGAEFDAELFVADSGKRYLNKILSNAVASVPSASSAPKAQEAKSPVVDADRAKHFTPKFQKKEESTTMSKSEWQAKDRSQLIGGLSHDAATMAASILNVQPAETVDDALTLYKKLLESMLKIRDEIK